jgi:putative intracellular protease/amidase
VCGEEPKVSTQPGRISHTRAVAVVCHGKMAIHVADLLKAGMAKNFDEVMAGAQATGYWTTEELEAEAVERCMDDLKSGVPVWPAPMISTV